MAGKSPTPINRALTDDFPVRQRDRFNLELRQTECADLDNGVGRVRSGEVVLAQRQHLLEITLVGHVNDYFDNLAWIVRTVAPTSPHRPNDDYRGSLNPTSFPSGPRAQETSRTLPTTIES